MRGVLNDLTPRGIERRPFFNLQNKNVLTERILAEILARFSDLVGNKIPRA